MFYLDSNLVGEEVEIQRDAVSIEDKCHDLLCPDQIGLHTVIWNEVDCLMNHGTIRNFRICYQDF